MLLMGEPQPQTPEEVKQILLSWITDDILKTKVNNVLNSVWEEFHKIPASRTGKYHPKECNVVPYGLVNHTLRVLWLCKLLCEGENITGFGADKIMAAAIVHDVGKVWFHPPRVKEGEFVDHGIKSAEVAEHYELPSDVVNMVKVHMSVWEGKNVVTISERILFHADLMASRKEIKVLTPKVRVGE
jgi:putative nucleotidyltransferase with HDIG domain